MTDLVDKIEWWPAFSWRKPDPKRDYGNGALMIRFIVMGPKGAVQWYTSTGWYLAAVREIAASNPYRERDKLEGWDLGYHALEPQYEGQNVSRESCEYCGGKPCYYDGSSLQAKELEEGFLAGGPEWVFKKLREYYAYTFEGGTYPEFTPEYQPHPDDRQ